MLYLQTKYLYFCELKRLRDCIPEVMENNFGSTV